MSEETDEELMRRYAREGERSAFQALFERYAPRLHGFFMRSVASETDANDLVQQTFLHFHRARADFRDGATVRPWIYTIAVNVKREHFRRRGRKPESALDFERHGEPNVGPRVTSAVDRLVQRSLQQLPEAQREVILLHWYEGWSFPQIAELVGASVSAVKVRAHRGYERLRAMLAEEGDGEATE